MPSRSKVGVVGAGRRRYPGMEKELGFEDGVQRACARERLRQR